jgi:hypothetical protein
MGRRTRSASLLAPKPPQEEMPMTTNARSTNLVEVVARFIALLDELDTALGPQPPAITPKEKRHASKPRKGAEKIIRQLAPIAKHHNADSAAVSSDAMMARLGEAAALQPLQLRLADSLKRVDDEVFIARGEAWEMGLQLYATLKRRAKSDGEVATAIEEVRKSFAYRHPLVNEGHPTKLQTRARARLRVALEGATKHGVEH